MRKVYLDYSATTPVRPEVLEEVKAYYSDFFGNASSTHSFGVAAKDALVRARTKIAKTINAAPSELYFTSGGTESDNWALKGVAFSYRQKGRHIITTEIEHPAVLNAAKKLQEHGFEISLLGVDEFGQISMEELKKTIRPDTVLVSVIFANNEIGTIQKIAEIGKLCREKDVIFHTDAVQAYGNVRIDVEELCIDLMSISAHKCYAMKGVGALYVRSGVKLDSLLDGGSQEKNLRAGTENIPGIVGMAKAAELAMCDLDARIEKLEALREYTLERVMKEIPDVKYNGHPVMRHPGNLHFSFRGLSSTALLIALDSVGIAVSAGSACSSGSVKPSHVLEAIHLSEEWASGSIRVSLGDLTCKEDCDYFADHLKRIVDKFINR